MPSISLYVESGRSPGAEFELTGRRSFFLGSASDADLRLTDSGIAPRHLRLIRQEKRWAAVAIAGARVAINGTWCKRGSLRPGDRLTLGTLVLRVVESNAWLEVTQGFCQGASYPIGRGLSLGRSFSSDVTLYDISCSLEHCRVERVGESYQVIDVGSTNGTRINGVSLVAGRPHPLRDGDRLRLGDTLLSFRLEGSPTESALASVEQGAWHALAEATLADRPTERLRRPRSTGPHLSGNLNRMAFTQVVQLLSYAGKSGDLLLDTPSGPAGVSFQRGRVHDAWFPEEQTPEESFYALARLSQGSFAFHRGERTRTPRIRLATLSLLLEAARRRDEA